MPIAVSGRHPSPVDINHMLKNSNPIIKATHRDSRMALQAVALFRFIRCRSQGSWCPSQLTSGARLHPGQQVNL